MDSTGIILLVLVLLIIVLVAFFSTHHDSITDAILRYHERKMQEYSHHIPRMYGFFIPVAIFLQLTVLILLIGMDVSPKVVGWQLTIENVTGIVIFGVASFMPLAYWMFQYYASRSPVLIEGDYGVIGKDEFAVIKQDIELVSTNPRTGLRTRSLAWWGKRNGQSKWLGADGGKGDGFHWAIYAWVKSKAIGKVDGETIWKPVVAFSVHRGYLYADWIGEKNEDEILSILVNDPVFMKVGGLIWLSTYDWQKCRLKGIPWQIADEIERDHDYKWYSPIVGAYNQSVIFGGSGSTLEGIDRDRLAFLEGQAKEYQAGLKNANRATVVVSNIAAGQIRPRE